MGPLDPAVTTNEAAFIKQALAAASLRADGRAPHDVRTPSFTFSPDGAVATVALGATLASARVSCSLEAPYADRQSEGSIRFTATYAPTAAPAACPAPGDRAGPAPTAAADALARLLDRAFVRSRAVDLESLCVAPGLAAWAVRVEVAVLSACGAAPAAAVLAAAAALRSFRRPDAGVDHAVGEEDGAAGRVVVRPPAAVDPVPLSLHEIPLATSFAWVGASRAAAAPDADDDERERAVLVLDPTAEEEAVAAGAGVALCSAGGHVLHLSAGGAAAPSSADVVLAARLATENARAVGAALDAALAAHTAAVLAARVRRHGGGEAVGDAGGRQPRGVTAAGAVDATAVPAREPARATVVAAAVGEEAAAVAAVADQPPPVEHAHAPAAAETAPSPAAAAPDRKPSGWRTAALRAKLARGGGGGDGGDAALDAVTALIAGAAPPPATLEGAVKKKKRTKK